MKSIDEPTTETQSNIPKYIAGRAPMFLPVLRCQVEMATLSMPMTRRREYSVGASTVSSRRCGRPRPVVEQANELPDKIGKSLSGKPLSPEAGERGDHIGQILTTGGP